MPDRPGLPAVCLAALLFLAVFPACVRAADTSSMPGFFSPSDATFIASSQRIRKTETEQVTRAAEEGDAKARYLHALILLGSASPGREQEAFKWMQKAAGQGLPEAESYLGTMYFSGQGTGKNRENAIHWYGKAIAKGYAPAMFGMACLYREEKNMENAVIWYEKSWQAGFPLAKTAYAYLLQNGEGIEKDEKKAMTLMNEAAADGEPLAQVIMGIHYLSGNLVPQNTEKGLEFIDRSAGQHYPLALLLRAGIIGAARRQGMQQQKD